MVNIAKKLSLEQFLEHYADFTMKIFEEKWCQYYFQVTSKFTVI